MKDDDADSSLGQYSPISELRQTVGDGQRPSDNFIIQGQQGEDPAAPTEKLQSLISQISSKNLGQLWEDAPLLGDNILKCIPSGPPEHLAQLIKVIQKYEKIPVFQHSQRFKKFREATDLIKLKPGIYEQASNLPQIQLNHFADTLYMELVTLAKRSVFRCEAIGNRKLCQNEKQEDQFQINRKFRKHYSQFRSAESGWYLLIAQTILLINHHLEKEQSQKECGIEAYKEFLLSHLKSMGCPGCKGYFNLYDNIFDPHLKIQIQAKDTLTINNCQMKAIIDHFLKNKGGFIFFACKKQLISIFVEGEFLPDPQSTQLQIEAQIKDILLKYGLPEKDHQNYAKFSLLPVALKKTTKAEFIQNLFIGRLIIRPLEKLPRAAQHANEITGILTEKQLQEDKCFLPKPKAAEIDHSCQTPLSLHEIEIAQQAQRPIEYNRHSTFETIEELKEALRALNAHHLEFEIKAIHNNYYVYSDVADLKKQVKKLLQYCQ